MQAVRALLLLLLTVAPAAAQSPATGTITGTVRYLGVVPPSQRIALTDGQILLHNDVVVDPKSKGLRDVIAVLEWKAAIPADAKAAPVLIDQKDMIFVPRVATVQEGRKVRFENSDLYNHGVSAASIHAENTFNVTTPAGQPYEHKFKAQKNPIPIGCALHSWMRAHVLVVPHPYHSVTDAAGKFTIERVPAGKHALTLIHPDTNRRETVSLEVIGGKAAEVTVEWTKLKTSATSKSAY
jgi:plastocyanin